MRLAALAAIAVACAGAAYGQDDTCRTDGQTDKARPEFVYPYNSATTALTNKDWTGALRSAAQARPYAMSGLQIAAVIQIQVAAIAETGDKATFMAAMEAALGTPCLPASVGDNYTRRLQELRSDAAPQQQ